MRTIKAISEFSENSKRVQPETEITVTGERADELIGLGIAEEVETKEKKQVAVTTKEKKEITKPV